MSWYYYLEGKTSFPFRARCIAANAVSPIRKGETVEVLRMAVEDACQHNMFVQDFFTADSAERTLLETMGRCGCKEIQLVLSSLHGKPKVSNACSQRSRLSRNWNTGACGVSCAIALSAPTTNTNTRVISVSEIHQGGAKVFAERRDNAARRDGFH